MKKSNKLIAIAMSAIFALGALTGCGGTNGDAQQPQNGGNTTRQDQQNENTGSTGNKIVVMSREDGSGTRGAFVELTGVEEKNDRSQTAHR